MTHPRYDRTSPSGVLWLGDVPSHWTLRRLGYFFDERREKVSDSDYPPLSVTKNGIVPQLETAAKTDDGDNRKRVAQGDFVINSRSDRKGSAGIAELDGSVSLINTVLRPHAECHARFVHYLLRSVAFQEEFYRYGQGIVADLWTTKYAEMRAILLAMPSPPEQTAIAAFLDRETGKIDALVEEQMRLIELLKEKRQAVISHAVTKGLNPNVRMNPSGVEWLGDVPEHWRVLPLRRIINSIDQGWSPQAHDREPTDDEPSVLRLSAIKDGVFQPEQRKALPDLTEEELENAPLVEVGDLLLTRANTPLLVGDCAIATAVARTIFSDLIYRLNLDDDEVDTPFALYMLRSDALRGQVRRDARGSSMTMAKIAHGHIKSWIAAFPLIEEQKMIAAHLETALAKLTEVQKETEKSVTLLHERKAALIAEAVTGHLDVRPLLESEELVA